MGMFLGAGGGAHSVRWHRGSLLVGGSGHGVGRQEPGFDPYGELEEWAQQLWPGAEVTHRWSAQDYAPFSGIPFVGYLPRTRKRAYLATGYEKWGMTGAVAAALLLDADLEGRREGWQRVLGMRPTLPQTIGVGIGAGAAVAAWYLVHGRLSGQRAAAITAYIVDRLLPRIREHALELVAAFGLTPELVRAPIADGGEQERQDEARAYYAALRASGEAPIDEKTLRAKSKR
jgi:hypothetical protein